MNKLEGNTKKVEGYAQQLLTTIFSSIEQCPMYVKKNWRENDYC